jgi:hypothetical protein
MPLFRFSPFFFSADAPPFSLIDLRRRLSRRRFRHFQRRLPPFSSPIRHAALLPAAIIFDYADYAFTLIIDA